MELGLQLLGEDILLSHDARGAAFREALLGFYNGSYPAKAPILFSEGERNLNTMFRNPILYDVRFFLFPLS